MNTTDLRDKYLMGNNLNLNIDLINCPHLYKSYIQWLESKLTGISIKSNIDKAVKWWKLQELNSWIHISSIPSEIYLTIANYQLEKSNVYIESDMFKIVSHNTEQFFINKH